MTEEEAKSWLVQHFGVQKTQQLRKFVDIVAEESGRQNLISASTLPFIWARHVVDSAQLILHARQGEQSWCDVGSGAGFPGLIVGILRERTTWLIEPRSRRANFLREVISTLGLGTVSVVATKAEAFRPVTPVDVVSARAVASTAALFAMTSHFVGQGTQFILPKGQHGPDDLASARLGWQGVFHVEQSLTSAESTIIIAEGVRRRCSASR